MRRALSEISACRDAGHDQEPEPHHSKGLSPAAGCVLAQRLDLTGLVDHRLHLAKHGVNSGAQALWAIGLMLAGQEPGHLARRGPIG